MAIEKKSTHSTKSEIEGDWSIYFAEYSSLPYEDGGWKEFYEPAEYIIGFFEQYGRFNTKNFLEIGSAGGFLVEEFLNLGWSAWGIEQYKPIVDQFRNLSNRNLHGNATDLSRFPRDYFDLIYVSCFCYLNGEPLEKAIKEMRRVSKRTGVIEVDGMFLMPNGKPTFEDEFVKTHKTTHEWGELLRKYGFRVLKTTHRYLLVQKRRKYSDLSVE